MEATALNDPYLEDFIAKYDQWIADGKIPHAARVIPIAESLHAQQWVMPTEQVLEILRGAHSVAVWPCVCRSHYQRCDKPVEVCIVLNKPADALVAKGMARRIPLEEAADVLRKADAHGLVHLGLFMPDHGLSAICSCCSCCCHELQILQKLGRRDRLARSEYVAVTAMEECAHCGICVDRCAFEARVMKDGRMAYRLEACMGCGLCVTVCPPEATRMQRAGEAVAHVQVR